MKELKRDEMMEWILDVLTDENNDRIFVGTSEDFNGSTNGIHLSGESMDEYKGEVIYDYYSENHIDREFGVLKKWEKELNKRGWYSEWYDGGTISLHTL